MAVIEKHMVLFMELIIILFLLGSRWCQTSIKGVSKWEYTYISM